PSRAPTLTPSRTPRAGRKGPVGCSTSSAACWSGKRRRPERKQQKRRYLRFAQWRKLMSKVFFSVTMSLDGCIGPERIDLDQPPDSWLPQWMELQKYAFEQR